MKKWIDHKTVLLASLIVVLAVLPRWMTSTFYLHVFIMIFYFSYLGACWNLLAGYVGLASLGHAMFVGTGAYTSSLLMMHFGVSPWIGMWAGAFFSLILGLFLGFLAFRYGLKGHYFLLVTIAFCEILKILVLNIRSFGGGSGVAIVLKGSGSPFWQFVFTQKATYYYVILGMLIGLLLLLHFLLRTRTGHYFVAVRENEDLAQASGIHVMKIKLIAISLSAALTSIAGTFYAQYICFIDPPSVFGLGVSVDLLIPAIVGGLGTLLGPVLGAFIVIPLGEIVRANLSGGTGGVHLIIYGSFLVFVILFMRKGLLGLFSRLSFLGRKG
jgi:branched-chain amino acid transport system permease protein